MFVKTKTKRLKTNIITKESIIIRMHYCKKPLAMESAKQLLKNFDNLSKFFLSKAAEY